MRVEVFRSFCDSFDLFASMIELNKYKTYLEIAYQDLANGTYHFTESDLQEYTNRMILKHIEENKLISQLDTISIPYSKHKLTLEYILKRFVEQNINKQVEAEVLLDLFNFLHTEYNYPRDRTEEVERALEAKVNFCNTNSSYDEDELLNKKEAAKLLGISEPTLNNWLRDDLTLPFNRPGHKYQFNRKDLRSWKYNKNCLKDLS